MPRADILERKAEILQWIEEQRPKAFICQELKCKPETLNSYLAKMGIEYKGQQTKKGQYKGGTKYRPALYYIVNHIAINSHKLKEKLIRDGLKEKKCELCGISQWLDYDLPLELHHKNGDHQDNDLDNLMILCPNCHSIQEGNSGANVGRYKVKETLENEEKQNKIHLKKEKTNRTCIDCNAIISSRAIRCKSCAAKEKQKDKTAFHPSREELKQLIRSTSFLQIGNMYGVTDNAVRKWCDNYQLPRKVSDIKSYSDEEWEKI